MLTRSEVRQPLCLLLTLTILSFVTCLVGVVLISGKRLMGFLMTRGSTTLCNSYLTTKYSVNNIQMYDTAFASLVFSAGVQVLTLIQLIYLLIKYCQSEQQWYIQQWTQTVFVRLYVMYSLAVMGTGVTTGKYFAINFEQLYKCQGHKDVDKIVINIVISVGLLASFICLVMVFIWYLGWIQRTEHLQYFAEYIVVSKERQTPFIQPKPQLSQGKKKKKKKKRKKSPKENTKHGSKNASDHSSLRQSDREQKIYLQYFEQLQRSYYMQSTPRKQVLTPLINAEISESDRVSDDPEEYMCVTYQNYKHRKAAKEKKKHDKEQRIKECFRKQEDKREEQRIQREKRQRAKQNIAQMAISPNDPRFRELFDDSQNDGKQSEVSDGEHFPYHYQPQSADEWKRFQAYKQELIRLYDPGLLKKKAVSPKHYQNLIGGRSKKQLDKLLESKRRPVRQPFNEERKNSMHSVDSDHSHKFRPRRQSKVEMEMALQSQDEGSHYSGQFKRQDTKEHVELERQSSGMHDQMAGGGSVLGKVGNGVEEVEYNRQRRMSRWQELKSQKLNRTQLESKLNSSKRRAQNLIEYIRFKGN